MLALSYHEEVLHLISSPSRIWECHRSITRLEGSHYAILPLATQVSSCGFNRF